MTERPRAELERLCAALGVPPELLERAVVLADEMLTVEEMVGGSSNADALARAVNVQDDVALRAGHFLGTQNALERVRVARRRTGRPDRTGPRDAEAAAQGVTVGVELAIAIRRLVDRGEVA